MPEKSENFLSHVRIKSSLIINVIFLTKNVFFVKKRLIGNGCYSLKIAMSIYLLYKK